LEIKNTISLILAVLGTSLERGKKLRVKRWVFGCARAELGERVKQSIGEPRNPYFLPNFNQEFRLGVMKLRVW